MLMIAETSFWTVASTLVFILLSGILTLVILIQKPKGGGLSGAFGGAGGSQQAVFGAKTGDFLTWATVGFFVMYIGVAICLVWLTRSDFQLDVDPPTISSETVPGAIPASAPDTPDTTSGTDVLSTDVNAVLEQAAEAAGETAAEASGGVVPEAATEPQ